MCLGFLWDCRVLDRREVSRGRCTSSGLSLFECVHSFVSIPLLSFDSCVLVRDALFDAGYGFFSAVGEVLALAFFSRRAESLLVSSTMTTKGYPTLFQLVLLRLSSAWTLVTRWRDSHSCWHVLRTGTVRAQARLPIFASADGAHDVRPTCGIPMAMLVRRIFILVSLCSYVPRQRSLHNVNLHLDTSLTSTTLP